MFLLTARRKYIRQIFSLIILLTAIVGSVYYFFIPHRYFVWFPIIPVFFLLYGYFNISMFTWAFKMGNDKMVPMFMINKGIKFFASIVVIILYCFLVRHEIISFIVAFVFFYIPFLVVETVYFIKIEMILKRKRRIK